MKLTAVGINAQGERITLTPFDPKDLTQYPGAYWNDELETKYTIDLKNGKLVAEHAHHGEIALTPVAKDPPSKIGVHTMYHIWPGSATPIQMKNHFFLSSKMSVVKT